MWFPLVCARACAQWRDIEWEEQEGAGPRADNVGPSPRRGGERRGARGAVPDRPACAEDPCVEVEVCRERYFRRSAGFVHIRGRYTCTRFVVLCYVIFGSSRPYGHFIVRFTFSQLASCRTRSARPVLHPLCLDPGGAAHSPEPSRHNDDGRIMRARAPSRRGRPSCAAS